MKHLTLVLALAAVAAAPACAGQLDRDALARMSAYYRFFETLPDDRDGHPRYVYADDQLHLHVYSVDDDGISVLEWETNLGSPVRGLIVMKTRDGQMLIVVATAKGKVYAYDANNYNLERENLMEPFTSLQAMAIEELDDDGIKEVILLGIREGEDVPRLFVYDGATRALKWRSQESFAASEILVANLDDDRQPEIILNTGTVIDARFQTIETDFIQQGGFGVRMRVQDINGDGYPEIFGTGTGDQLRVYDPYARRRLW